MTIMPSAVGAVAAPYKVDISCGQNIGRVSSEWFSRPDDERFLSLPDICHHVHARVDAATTHMAESQAIRVVARRGEPERLDLVVPGCDTDVALTHWSFGQLLWSLVGAPASYLRGLPAMLAGINL
jgi:hypothetical protein